MLRLVDAETCVGCGAYFKTCAFDVFRLNTDQPSPSACRAACPVKVHMRDYFHLLQQGKQAVPPSLLSRNTLPLITPIGDGLALDPV